MLKMIHHPTVQIPNWTLSDHHHHHHHHSDSDDPDLSDSPTDLFSSDEFRMYDFKVRRCPRGRAHDWTDCPYAHPGEKARRRDPLRFHYSGVPCPEFKKGTCARGDACELAHGVFECWLHPARYRTQPCKDGTACRRRVCFFAHTPEQLRVLSPKESPAAAARVKRMGTSPTSILSPPVSPEGLVIMMRKMRLDRMQLMARFEEEKDEGLDGIDVGWVSELVK